MPKRTSVRHLQGSKWTALTPVDREKHFIVEEVRKAKAPGSDPAVVCMRALISDRRIEVDPEELSDASRWRPGWR